MKQFVKQIITKIPFYHFLRNQRVKRKNNKELILWENAGKPVPPPHIIKQQVLREYSKIYGSRILVETGTYLGDMVEAMKADFDRIYSIELGKDLYGNAALRFKAVQNVVLIHGDSGTELGNLMSRIDQPTLFWLDGHYSAGVTAKGEKDTPIFEELSCILNASDLGHVIIIDDARCFGTEPTYPSIAELTGFVKAKRPGVDITVQFDSIRITPTKLPS